MQNTIQYKYKEQIQISQQRGEQLSPEQMESIICVQKYKNTKNAKN